jgi:autotransporter family porin
MPSALLTLGGCRRNSPLHFACGKSCDTTKSRLLPVATCWLIFGLYHDDARAQATPCATVGTGQVLATNTCTVATSTIGTTTTNPAAVTASGGLAIVTATGVTTNVAVANGFGFRAINGGQILADSALVRTTSTAAAAAGQTGVLASGPGSLFSASGLTVVMTPAAGVSLTAIRAENQGKVTLAGGQIDIGSAGSGRNFNHGLVASGAGSEITATGTRITANSNFSDAVRAELGGTITLSGATLTANGAGNPTNGPSAAAAALSGGKLFINSGTTLTGGVANQAYGLWVSGTGSQATVSGATIAATGGSKSAGVIAEDSATVNITGSTVSSATYFGVSAAGGAQVTLTDTHVSSTGTSAISAGGTGSSITVNGGLLEGFYQVPTVVAGNATVTVNNAAIRSNGNANAPGVYAGLGSTVILNGGTVDAFGTTDRGQRVKGIAAATAGAVLTATGVTIHTYGDEALGVAADDGGTVTLNGGTVLTDKRNAIGIYSGVDPTKPGAALVTANTTHVETFGEIAHGAQAQSQTILAIPATVTLDQNSTVTTHGVGSVGLRAILKGRINAIQSTVSTEGTGAHGMLALGDLSLVTATNSLVQTTGAAAHGGVARDGGRIIGSGATVTATGTDSAGLYVVGETAASTAEFSTSSLSAANGPGIAMAGTASVSLTGGTVSSNGDWLRVGTVSDFPALGTPEAPIPLPEEPQIDVDFTSAPPTPTATLASVVNAAPVVRAQVTPGVATVTVSGSTVTGSATTLPGGISDVTFSDSAIWNLTGNSNLTNLSNTASQILFSPPSGGNFKTLTVANYTGGAGSVIGLNTVLASDGAASDRLVVAGGTASGQSALRIKNAGGPGALTLHNGIMVVDAVNGGTTAPATFVLDGRAVAGAYEYRLARGSVDDSNTQAWYLRSTQAPEPPVPTPSSDVVPTALYRPEVGAYLSNQRVAAGMLVHSLHDRLGEPQWSEQQTFDNDDPQRRSVWLRFVGKDIGSRSSDGNFDVSSDVFLLQGGGDIAQWSIFRGDDRLHLGAMLGYGWASSDASAKGNPATATADTNGVSFGAYATWFQNDASRLGWYTDLWAQYGWFSNHVTGQSLPSVGYNSQVLALSAEAGYAWYPFRELDWAVEPQGQVIYEHGYESAIDEPNGTHIDGARGSGWITRLGVRVHRTWIDTAGKRFQPYVTLNWWHDEVDNIVAFNQVSLHDLYPQNRYEIKLGIDVEGHKGWTGWSNVGWQVGSQAYHAFIGRIGVKKTW